MSRTIAYDYIRILCIEEKFIGLVGKAWKAGLFDSKYSSPPFWLHQDIPRPAIFNYVRQKKYMSKTNTKKDSYHFQNQLIET